jgi:hypothetical protein
MSEFDKGALRYVFPEELLRYFDIVESGIHTDKPTGEDYLEVVFEEKNTLPEGYSKDAYESKGFFDKRVQDFPLRGKAVFLKVRRRRWRHARLWRFNVQGNLEFSNESILRHY